MRKTCAFCQISGAGSTHQKPIWNTILFQSANFVATPTIGSLVEGWLLVATKKHCICMGALEEELVQELQEFKHLVINALSDCYGDIAAFEHGPSQEQQAAGCGVDHAHLHLVPTMCALRSSLASFYENTLDWNRVSQVQGPSTCFAAGKSYLYCEQKGDDAYVLTDTSIKSQSFRRVLAEHIGLPDHYNWREHPYLHNAAQTVQTIQEWKLNQNPSVLRMLGTTSE